MRAYDQSKATTRETMTFAASLQFFDPQHLPAELCIDGNVNEVRIKTALSSTSAKSETGKSKAREASSRMLKLRVYSINYLFQDR